MNKVEAKQPALAKHDATVLDLAFVMDCTGSMGSYIASATETIRQIVEEIVAMEKSDIQLALVEYRDHPPQDSTFVTRTHDFTASVKTMKGWLEACSAQGGGDGPEAVADGLHDALKLSWRANATKICVCISDAPPHGLGIDGGDGFPNGCPLGIDPLDVVQKMAEKGITLYCVGCEPAIMPYKGFFSALAYKTGGQYVPLRNAKLLAKVIVGGALEEISLEKLMAEVQQEVQQMQARGVTDEKALASHVQSSMASRKVKTSQLQMNNASLARATEDEMGYAKMGNMSDLRKAYKASEGGSGGGPAAAPAGGFSFSGMMSKATSAFRGSPAPPMAMAAPAAAAPAMDSYAVAKDDISMEQSERMVQKALNRMKK